MIKIRLLACINQLSFIVFANFLYLLIGPLVVYHCIVFPINFSRQIKGSLVSTIDLINTSLGVLNGLQVQMKFVPQRF